MKFHTVKSNARRAARATYGTNAKEGVDYELVAGAGGHAVRPIIKARPAKPGRARKAPAADPRDGAARAGQKFRQALKAKKAQDKAAGGAWVDQLCAMLARPKGATALEVGAAFGWLEHTSRARISVGPRSRNARAERTREQRGGHMVSVYRLATELPLGQTRDELGVRYVKPVKAKAA